MKKGLKRKILFISGIISCMALFTSCNINTSNNTISSDNVISENETNNTTLETTIEDNSITTTVDDSSITSNENVNDNTTTSTTSDSGEIVDVAEAYTATFVIDSNVKVLVYDTKDMTGEGIEALTAKSKDGTTGEEIGDGSGQINFKLVFEDGYELENLTITPIDGYTNLKGSADTGVENGYRITKVSSDLTITITTKAIAEESEDEEGFVSTFELTNCKVYVYDTQDMSGEGTLTTKAVAKDSALGTVLTDGNGQINFIVVADEGYYIDNTCISILGTYKNLKTPADTGVENGYRITKISSDLTITVEAKLLSEAPETDDSFSIISENNSNTYILNGYATTGSFTYTYENNILTIDTTDVLSLTLDGTYYGGIIINSEYDVDIVLNNVEINSSDSCPLYINTTGNTSIKAEATTTNTIRDNRELVDEASTDVRAAIYVLGDLELKGTGEIYVYSANNNGIHSKDDLNAKKLTLTINVCDNALKGNDSITIESGNYTLIARQGDGLKTSNSSLSSGGAQKGTITINDGVLNIYAACDGMDAAYDVIINNNPTINIYTDKYSTYSEEVTYTSDNIYYVRSTSNTYKYSIYYYNSSTNEYVWKDASTSPTYTVSGQMGRTYYYYQIDKPIGYDKMYVYVYSSTQTQGQDSSYYKKSSSLTINDNYDTIAYSGNNFSFTNYTTASSQPGGGMGGMNDGNTDKGDYSTKGIKADNEIIINGGTIYIKSYDDAIHANSDTTLESSVTPLGNVTINGGTITVYSNDDGIHADGILEITGGTIVVENSYEGLEGTKINVSGGYIKVVSKDDGFNSTLSTGSYGITITGGEIYVYAGGDGLDSNTTTSYGGILIDGGKTVVISTSGGNSCIDTEQGYTYKSGYIVAMCPQGMTSECEKVSGGVSKYGKSTTASLTKDKYLVISNMVVIKLPVSISSGYVIELGNTTSTISQSTENSYELDANGIYWIA